MLAAASENLAKHHANVLSGYHDTVRWSFFADLTDCDATIEQVQRELASIGGVSDVVNTDSVNGIIVDSLHFPIMLAGKRAIILRAETLNSILVRIREMFGEDGAVAKVLLFTMGEAAGQAMFKATAAQIGAKVRDELANIINIYSATGFGIFRLSDVDLDRGTATVIALENFECASHTRTRSKPFSQFVRGHLAGFFSGVFGRRVDAVEAQCVARGDGCCEFRVEPEAGRKS